MVFGAPLTCWGKGRRGDAVVVAAEDGDGGTERIVITEIITAMNKICNEKKRFIYNSLSRHRYFYCAAKGCIVLDGK